MAGPVSSLSPPAAPLQLQVLGPDAADTDTLDIRRLMASRSHTHVRRERLAHATCVVARTAGRTVGLAAYERTGAELRVLDVAVDPSLTLCPQDVVALLLHALETAALAGGCRRVVLLPAAVVAAASLEALGYRMVSEGYGGGWLEKTFS